MADTGHNVNKTVSNNNANFPGYKATEPNVTPAFIFSSQTGDLDGYEIGMKVISIVGEGLVRTVQQVKGLWRVYFNTQQSKIDLITEGLTIGNTKVKCYNSNPFTTGALRSGVRPDQLDKVNMVRVLIKDLYESVANEQVEYMMVHVFKVKLASEVQYAEYRRNEKLTGLRNGDRFCWVHPDQLDTPLPRFAKCGNYNCRIFHRDQFKDQQKECFQCFGLGHLSKDCTKGRCCRVCKEPDHKEGTPMCNFYTDEIDKVFPFGGKNDPFSNHFEKSFVCDHVPSVTAEGHWFNQKSMAHGQDKLAMECINAGSGREAKALSRSIRCTPDWDYKGPRGVEMMRNIVKSKVEQVEEAKECLKFAWENDLTIVESVHSFHDKFWGSGMDKQTTMHTKPEHWPGKNMLGKIWMDLALELFGEKPVQKVKNDQNESKGDQLQRQLDLERVNESEASNMENIASESESETEVEEQTDGQSVCEVDNTEGTAYMSPAPSVEPTGQAPIGDIGTLVSDIRQKVSYAQKLSHIVRARSASKSKKKGGRARSESPCARSRRSESQKRALQSPTSDECKSVKNVKIDSGKFENGSTNVS